MNISIKCEKCSHVFVRDDENDLMLMYDFKEQKITFLCRNKNCGHENVLDFGAWKDKQTKSPLPKIWTGR